VPLASKSARLAERLCKVGLWHDRGDHYEIHDYSDYQEAALKESREARREYERDRKRDQRTRNKTDNQQVVRDMSGTCPEGQDHAVPSVTRAIPSRPVPTRTVREPEESDGAPAPAAVAAPLADGPKSVRPKSKPAALAALETALKAEMAKRGDTAPSLSRSLSEKASKRVREYSELRSVTLDVAAERLAGAWAALGGSNAWKLCDVPFERPVRAAGGLSGRRMLPSDATTHEDFADAPSIEEQFSRVSRDPFAVAGKPGR
jgi:hypothetical protein